ncbi:hypothetical protein AB0J35_21805 [Nonomuraea angiospora]|uniref:hypothetical protein n=1 Tax=Nonomuraea angiospora TaxID=46172 RepID=UPI00342B2F56
MPPRSGARGPDGTCSRGTRLLSAEFINNGVVSLVVDTYLPDPDASERPRTAAAPGPRPASPHQSEIPEPASWYQRQDNPPNSSLIVWTGTGWRTLVWTNWQTGITAQNLGIGPGGPYERAEAWGPGTPTATCTTGPRKAASCFSRPTWARCSSSLSHAIPLESCALK